MDLVTRVRGIILNPKGEWEGIETEAADPGALATGYVLPLVAMSVLASVIGQSVVGFWMGPMGTIRVPLGRSLLWGVAQVILTLVGVYVSAAVVSALGPTFGAERDFSRAFRLVSYSATPAWVAGLLMILPVLGILSLIGGLYSLYLLYLGIPSMMRAPENRALGYTAASVVVIIVVYIVVGILTGMTLGPRMIR